jgi:tetratricopeptide (TPR) repeat protein/serine/threonine protein kinase
MPPPLNQPQGPTSLDLYGPTVGSTPVPGYTLTQRLGQGGCGEVWKAEGPGGFPVALKFVRLSDDAAAVEKRSLEILKEIRHSNLLGVFGAWQVGGNLVIAMEFADGSLLDQIKKAREQGLQGIPPDQLMEFMADAARGIDYLNEARHILPDGSRGGIQHRDIKPANLLVVGGSVKVADFGLAKLLSKAVASNTGNLTPGYAAPECFRGQTSDRSDQYSLAASYCQMRGGRLPFRGDAARVMLGHLHEDPDLTMIPEAERAAVARGLAKMPEERYPTCRAFIKALAAVVDTGRASFGQPVPSPVGREPTAHSGTAPSPYHDTRTNLVDRTERPRQLALPPRRRRVWAIALGVVGALTMLGLLTAQIVWVVLSARETKPEAVAQPEPTKSPTPEVRPPTPEVKPPTPEVKPPTPEVKPPTALERGKAALEQRRLDDALRLLDQAVQDERSATAYHLRGRARLMKHAYDQAESDFTAALAKDPNQAEIYRDRAEARLEQLAYDSALADADEALSRAATPDSYVIRARIQLGLLKYDRAADDADDALKLRPNYPPALAVGGLARGDRGEHDVALEMCNRAVKEAEAPGSVHVLNCRGSVRNLRKEYDGALTDFTAALNLEPNYARTYNHCAVVRINQKEYALALEDCEKAIKLQPGFYYAFYNRGRAQAAQKSFSDAAESYTEALRINPRYAIAYLQRGWVRRQLKEPDRALADFDEALKINAEYAAAHYEKGVTYRTLNRPADALKSLDEALRISPKYTSAYYERGLTYKSVNRPEDALKSFDEALKVSPTYASAHYEKGETLRLLNRLSDAIKSYDEAINNNDRYTSAYFARAVCKRYLGRFPEAIKDADVVLRLSPEVPAGWFERGEALRLQGSYDDAVKDFTQALELNPRYAAALACRGACYLMRKRLDDALKDLDDSVEIYNRDPFSLNIRGNIHYERKEYDLAVKDYTAAIKLAPKAYVYRNRAQAYLMLGKTKEREADVKEADRLDPPKAPDAKAEPPKAAPRPEPPAKKAPNLIGD